MKVTVKVKKRRHIYKGRIIDLISEDLVANGIPMQRDTIQHPGGVVVVPMFPNGDVLLIEQFRWALKQTILELPAGTLERGEAPRSWARRELIEETGWRAGRLRKLCRFSSAPGFCSEVMSVFLAEGLRPDTAAPEPDEFVKPRRVSLGQALRLIDTGRIWDAKTIIGLLLAAKGFKRQPR